MTAKKKITKKRDPNTLEVRCGKNESGENAMARTAISPTVQAGVTLHQLNKGKFTDLELMALIDTLNAQNDSVKNGGMVCGEEMLMTQAHTLDSLFHTLTRRAVLNMGDYLNAAESYMRLALKAQSQCRTTLEALSGIKNPPMMGYVRQANIAGYQQVNNDTVSVNRNIGATENKNPQNKLLGEKNGEWLDTGTTGATGTTNQDMATMGEIDRAKDD